MLSPSGTATFVGSVPSFGGVFHPAPQGFAVESILKVTDASATAAHARTQIADIERATARATRESFIAPSLPRDAALPIASGQTASRTVGWVGP